MRCCAALRAHPLGRDAAIDRHVHRRRVGARRARYRLRPTARHRARRRAAAADLLRRMACTSTPASTSGIGLSSPSIAARASTRSTSTRRAICAAPACTLARDDEVRASSCWRGTGGVFCSGADLKYIRAGGRRGGPRLSDVRPRGRTPEGTGERFKQILEYLHSTIAEIRRAPKPFIAAVDGIAAAGGFGLAMCCDLVFASRPRDRSSGRIRKTRSDRRGELHVHAAAASSAFTERWSWCCSIRGSTRRRGSRAGPGQRCVSRRDIRR